MSILSAELYFMFGMTWTQHKSYSKKILKCMLINSFFFTSVIIVDKMSEI